MGFNDAWTSGPDILRGAIARVSPDIQADDTELTTLSVLLFVRPEAERDPEWTREQVTSYFGVGTAHALRESVCNHLSDSIQQDIRWFKARQIAY